MSDIFTPAELAEIHASNAPRYVWSAVGPFVRLGVCALLFALTGPLYRLASRITRQRDDKPLNEQRAFGRAMTRLWGDSSWGTALVFTLLYCALLTVLFLPKNLYFHYFLDKAHGLTNYTPWSFAVDLFKGFWTGALATAFLAFGCYGLIRKLKRWWLVLGVPAGVLLLFSAALDPYRGQLFFDQAPLPEGELRGRLTELLQRAQIDFADIDVQKASVTERRVQAFFAGQGPSRRIVLNDLLLESMSADEVVAAVAHEAGHVHEPRWLGRIGAAFALIFVLFLFDRLLEVAARRRWLGATSKGDIRTLPLLRLMLFVLFALSEPFSAAVSRQREVAADEYAVKLTEDPEAFRSLLIKAARINKNDPFPPRWLVLMGLDHPPIGERIAWAETQKKSGQPAGP